MKKRNKKKLKNKSKNNQKNKEEIDRNLISFKKRNKNAKIKNKN